MGANTFGHALDGEHDATGPLNVARPDLSKRHCALRNQAVRARPAWLQPAPQACDRLTEQRMRPAGD